MKPSLLIVPIILALQFACNTSLKAYPQLTSDMPEESDTDTDTDADADADILPDLDTGMPASDSDALVDSDANTNKDTGTPTVTANGPSPDTGDETGDTGSADTHTAPGGGDTSDTAYGSLTGDTDTGSDDTGGDTDTAWVVADTNDTSSNDTGNPNTDTADTGWLDTDTGLADTDPALVDTDTADTGWFDTDTGFADSDTVTADTAVTDTGFADTDWLDTDTGWLDSAVVDTDAGAVDTDTSAVDSDTDITLVDTDTGIVDTDTGWLDTAVIDTDTAAPDTSGQALDSDTAASDSDTDLVLGPNDSGFFGDSGDFWDTASGTLGTGDLVITEIMVDSNYCAEPDGEYVEVLNTSGVAVDISGLELWDNVGQSALSSLNGDLVLMPGEYALLSRTSTCYAPSTEHALYQTVALANSGDQVAIVDNGVEIDRVNFSNWSIPSGASLQLDPLSSNATDNDNESAWCASLNPIATGQDLGSPGSVNHGCGGSGDTADTGISSLDTGDSGISSIDTDSGLTDTGAALSCPGTGMTWRLRSHDAALNVDHVGCGTCDPYHGDTQCTSELPILCFKSTGASNPGVVTDPYNGWSQGEVQITPNTSGCLLTSLSAANAICEAEFGPGWRMAEFHDGNSIGWNYYAHGDTKATSRFWVHIDDQKGNCWNSTP